LIKESEITIINKLVQAADTSLSDCHSLFSELTKPSNLSEISENPSAENIQTLQLVLQYRLDTQDALIKLLQIDQSLLQLLGIEPSSSYGIKLENLAYALGHEDLHILLTELNALVNILLRIIYKYQQDKKRPYSKQKSIYQKLNKSLQECNKLNKQFGSNIEEINQFLVHFLKRETIGPVQDHIAALKGPVSRFFQLIQSGLKNSYQLYSYLNKNKQEEKYLYTILEQAEDVLHQLSLQNTQQHFFHPNYKPGLNPDHLSQRAAKKRLGNFFNP